MLAVEVSGQDEDETMLRNKAEWYLRNGTGLVWLILPELREVIVMRSDGESRHRQGEQLVEHALLPGLAPLVNRFLTQLDRA